MEILGFEIAEHNGLRVLRDRINGTALMYVNSPESEALAAELLGETFDDKALTLAGN